MAEARRVDHIQALRALAAGLVVISHIAKEMLVRRVSDPFGILNNLLTWQFGVDIFFIISGFIMYYVTFGKPSGFNSAFDFIKKRIIRVVPLYWFFTLLVIVPMVLLPQEMKRTGISAIYLICSFLFIPYPRPGLGDMGPVLALGWTLNYEMLFYVVFASLIAFGVRRKMLALTLIFVGAVVIGHWIPMNQSPIWYWTRSCIIEFVLGSFLAWAFLRGVALPRWVGLVAIFSGIVIWQAVAAMYPVAEAASNYRGYTWGLAASLIVGGFTLVPSFARALEWGGPAGLIQRVGDASYSLYLSHMFVVRVCTMTIGSMLFGNAMLSPLYLIITFSACVVVSMISYKFLEVPITNFARRNSRG